jgi:hypothetical protein
MKKSIRSRDFGAFVFGRKILKNFPQASLHFEVQMDFLSPFEESFWEKGMENSLNGKTKFGRIACFFDRKNNAAREFCKNIDIQKYKYIPRKPHRAARVASNVSFETQILHEMANEGMADTVEFRRLARKYIRSAKHANVDTIFWLETIFAEEKTRQILNHLAGSQIENVFPVDFFEMEWVTDGDHRVLEIKTGDDLVFTHSRAEQILRTKVKVLVEKKEGGA